MPHPVNHVQCTQVSVYVVVMILVVFLSKTDLMHLTQHWLAL